MNGNKGLLNKTFTKQSEFTWRGKDYYVVCCHDMQHEELLEAHPEKWVEEIKRVAGRIL